MLSYLSSRYPLYAFFLWDEEMRHQWFTSLVKRASNPHRDAYDWAITLRSSGCLIGCLMIAGAVTH